MCAWHFFCNFAFAVRSLREREADIRKNERQALGYLILKIWTIFNSTQMTSNGAHADVYISVLGTVIYAQKRELFTCYS